MVLPGLDRLRRGRSNSNHDDVEQQRAAGDRSSPQSRVDVEMSETLGPNSRGRLFPVSRPVWPAMFRGRTEASTGNAAVHRQVPRTENDDDEAESPKTPRFTLGLPSLPSTRLHLPHLTRTWTNGSNGPASRPPTARPNTSRGAAVQSPRSQSRFPFFSRSTAASPIPVPEPAVMAAASASPNVGSQNAGPNTSERNVDAQHGEASRTAASAVNAADGGRRRRSGDGVQRQNGPPRKFMFCFPWIRSRRVRTQILRCFVSGMFLTLLLAVYLALSITKNINNSEFTVLLILIILFTTIFFCHSLIRLCMLVIRPRPEEDRRSHMQQLMAPGGYAVPRQPIRVVLARDEETAGIESDSTKIKPPAYGMWRESVRVDPNRLFWQRNENAPAESSRTSESRSGPRPPSYASDDGVTYVVEARPRSMVPTTDVPLPPHPSERGRLDGRGAPTW